MQAVTAWVNVLCLCALILGPAIALRRRGARWKWFALGVASWTAALVVKLVLNGVFGLVESRASAWQQGVWYGSVSAACELGMTALLLRPPLPAADVLAFGAGVGSFEVAFKVLVGVVSAQPIDGAASGDPAWPTSLLGLGENASCVVSHTSTRVLVYLTLAHRRPVPALIAFATFAFVDGLVSYGSACDWPWASDGVYGPFVALLVVLASIETAAARAYWIRLERT